MAPSYQMFPASCRGPNTEHPMIGNLLRIITNMYGSLGC